MENELEPQVSALCCFLLVMNGNDDGKTLAGFG
jgi:hypothetical protein